MRNQCQGVRSTKYLPHPVTERPIEEKNKYVLITMYELKGKIYTDQTGKLPHHFSRGNKYQMIVHKIDDNSTWIEPMKKIQRGR